MAGVPPPPRQLEVRRFAAAQAGEFRSLHSAVSALLDSSGRRTQQPRSARRRTMGHIPSKRRRRSGDGAPRLRTLLWHAKRFSMERRWGFVLPVGAQGRGRGSRSVLKQLKNGTVVHDAS